jgi:Calx-beta domain-containing protein
MTFLHRLIVVLALGLLATSSLAQQPAKKLYPTDPAGRADFNATCLPCRGFAQSLRMYEDAIKALEQERDKRSAALKAITAALLGGTPLTDAQKDQGKIDGDALRVLLEKLDLLGIERANAERTLDECMKQYCPAPPPDRNLWYNPSPPKPAPPPAPPIEDSAECSACRDAESKYRDANAQVEAADRKAREAFYKRQGISYRFNDPASPVPVSALQAEYDAADKAYKAAEAEATRLQRIRMDALLDLKICNRERCRGNPEDGRRYLMPGGGTPSQPPLGVMPGGGTTPGGTPPAPGTAPAGGPGSPPPSPPPPAGTPVTPPIIVPGAPGAPTTPPIIVPGALQGGVAQETARADCPACADAESKYRDAIDKLAAADRRLQEARNKQAAALSASLDESSVLSMTYLQRVYDQAVKAVNDAEAEVERLTYLRHTAHAELTQCNRDRCGGAPSQPPTGVLPGGGGITIRPDPVSPAIIGPPVGYGITDKLEVGAASGYSLSPDKDWSRGLGVYGAFSVMDQDKLDLGPSANVPLGNWNYPSLGTPIAPAGGPCGCDELLRLSNEAASKSGFAVGKVDEAFTEMINSRRDYDAAAKDATVPPAKRMEYRDAVEAWQEAGREWQKEQDDQDALAKLYKSQYDDCMKRCTAPDPPRLIVAINFGGNNPFGPNSIGGGLVITPPGNPGAPGSLQFSSPNYGGAEGGAVLITVVRTGGRRGAASVSYQTSAGNATAGADYQPVSGTLTWADGDDSPKSFSIALTDDTEVEAVETFNVSLNTFTGASAGSPAVAVVSIADNDSTSPAPAGSLQFSSSQYGAAESGGAATITVLRVNGSSGPVSVQYFTGPGSATAGSDYQAVNGTLQWPNGDVGGRTFTVPIIDDTLSEQTETFFVTLNNPTGGATLGVPATATVSIQDNDASTPIGPCGALGNAWQPNAGGPYTCSGSCQPIPSSPTVTVTGDLVTINPFHAGGAATFQGCGATLNSQSNNMIFFGQGGHRATITRQTNTSFSGNVNNGAGGSCDIMCGGKPPPVR